MRVWRVTCLFLFFCLGVSPYWQKKHSSQRQPKNTQTLTKSNKGVTLWWIIALWKLKVMDISIPVCWFYKPGGLVGDKGGKRVTNVLCQAEKWSQKKKKPCRPELVDPPSAAILRRHGSLYGFICLSHVEISVNFSSPHCFSFLDIQYSWGPTTAFHLV